MLVQNNYELLLTIQETSTADHILFQLIHFWFSIFLFLLHCGDPHELMQLLHHAVVWQQRMGYFIVGSHSNVMAVYEVFFDDCIFDAYHKICKHLFNHDLTKLYIPSGQVPKPPDSWVSAFKCKSLKSLNLDAESFKFKLGLWRAVNLDYLNNRKKSG